MTRCCPPLSSEQTREDGRPVILAGGDFNDGDTMAATALTLTPEEFHAADGSFADRAANWFSYLKEGQLPPLTVNRRVAEQWRVSLPDDGQETHTLRYLPSQDASHLRLYVNDGGGWQAVSYDTVGSYLSFTAGGASPEIRRGHHRIGVVAAGRGHRRVRGHRAGGPAGTASLPPAEGRRSLCPRDGGECR
ncbi:MAG: hypothetical protein ACLS3F_07625 [Oscillospiraceae bacterium]